MKRLVSGLCILLLLCGTIAGCAPAVHDEVDPTGDVLLYTEEGTGAQSGETDESGQNAGELPEAQNIPVPTEATNSTLVTISTGLGLAGQSVAGTDEGFYQTVLSGDGKACYILYTEYANRATRWLKDENGTAVKLPAEGCEFAVLPAGDTIFILRLGRYEWDGAQVGGALYAMNPDGTGLQTVMELPNNHSFWPASAVVYDGQGIYCNVAHYNGAKGTADMMLAYVYADGKNFTEMEYYPMDYAVPLLVGSAGDAMILRTAESDDFRGPGTIEDYEAGNVRFTYELYNWATGTMGEPVMVYESSDLLTFIEGDRLYLVKSGGGLNWYDMTTGDAGVKSFEFPTGGESFSPAMTTAGSYAAVYDGTLVVSLDGVALRLNTHSDNGWLATGSYNPADYSGAIWAAGPGLYIVKASEAEEAYYTAGMPLFGLDGELVEAEEEDEDEPPEWIAETAVPVWLVWPFPEERPVDMTLFLLVGAEGYWEGDTGRVPLLPN